MLANLWINLVFWAGLTAGVSAFAGSGGNAGSGTERSADQFMTFVEDAAGNNSAPTAKTPLSRPRPAPANAPPTSKSGGGSGGTAAEANSQAAADAQASESENVSASVSESVSESVSASGSATGSAQGSAGASQTYTASHSATGASSHNAGSAVPLTTQKEALVQAAIVTSMSAVINLVSGNESSAIVGFTTSNAQYNSATALGTSAGDAGAGTTAAVSAAPVDTSFLHKGAAASVAAHFEASTGMSRDAYPPYVKALSSRQIGLSDFIKSVPDGESRAQLEEGYNSFPEDVKAELSADAGAAQGYNLASAPRNSSPSGASSYGQGRATPVPVLPGRPTAPTLDPSLSFAVQGMSHAGLTAGAIPKLSPSVRSLASLTASDEKQLDEEKYRTSSPAEQPPPPLVHPAETLGSRAQRAALKEHSLFEQVTLRYRNLNRLMELREPHRH